MLPEVDRLQLVWNRTLQPPLRRLALAIFVLILFGAALLARVGTDIRRLGAMLLVLGTALVLGVLGWRQRRNSQDLRWALRRIGGADPELGLRAERALVLLEGTRRNPEAGSVELAELHLSRQIGRVSLDSVRAVAERRGRWAQRAAIVAAAAALVLVGLDPVKIVEGLDVLMARRGLAPLNLSYLHGLRIEVQPPEYLKEKPRQYVDEASIQAPYGSVVTFRGAAMHGGRRLVLTDGNLEIPFVEDGAGKVTARWPLREGVTLDIAARLGEVRIHQGEPIRLVSVPDRPPEVVVEGAPQTLKILEVSEIPVLYRATDDHGLREINLVLRAGPREERRVLARLDGDTRQDEGGYQLRSSDPFLQRAYLPVEVLVEARDNDPLTGPKWGKSSPLLLLPPALGEPEALRYEALVAVRDALVDLLAAEHQGPETTSPAKLERLHSEQLAPVRRALQRVSEESFGGVAVPGRTKMFLDGQLRKLVDALAAERKRPGKQSRSEAVQVIEGVVLVVDRVVLALAGSDARSVSKRLARVALDVADNLQRVRFGSQRAEDGQARVQAAMVVLELSGKALARLGTLGADLGSIVANDLRRLTRALQAEDLYHAELVARDLGLRLMKANPSFAGGAGGVGEGDGHNKSGAADEAASGEGEGAGGDEEDSFNAEQQALQELQQDHAGNMESTQQALRRASEGVLTGEFQEEARRHARAIRDTVRGFPDRDEGDEAMSSAREQAEQAAQALERGDLQEALEVARSAEHAMEEGAAAGRRAGDRTSRMVAEELEEARKTLAPERRWIEEVLQKMQRAARQGADLKETAEREIQLAERAREMVQRGQGAQGNLPEQVLERLQQAEAAMRDAARAMQQGQGEEALAHQRKAQNLLDGIGPQDDAQPEFHQRDEGGRSPALGPAAIPKADEHQGPSEFRRRVSEGLKQGQTPALREAIRRYAERLLK
ncbi:MAG: DUF4175 family protein [Myxococcales bacterium]|nr:DUF4175 family protein [Polyangiaceae bacterium]MDW8250649.1 DUF4175 family protein [Myxococcales bacterium]